MCEIFSRFVRFDPTDLTQTNVPLFFTRWITHFCAPTFIFLAGVAAYLYFQNRPQSKLKRSRYLITRGLWLVFLELTVVRMGWLFDPTYSLSPAGVLWAIGWSMVVLAALIRMPISLIAAIGILLIGGHNLFDNIHAEQLGRWGWLWAVLHFTAILLALPKYGLKAIIMPFIASPLMPADYGYDLPMIYNIWIILIIVLYPICSWYRNYKTKYPSKWLKYL